MSIVVTYDKRKCKFMSMMLPKQFYSLMYLCMYTVHCTLDMINIDKQLIPSFWSHIIEYKNKSRNILFLFMKVIAILRSCSTELVQSNI